MSPGKKIKNTNKFSRDYKFIWNWFQLNKTFLIEIDKYVQLIIVQIQMKNISKIFIIDNKPLAKLLRFLKIFVNVC